MTTQQSAKQESEEKQMDLLIVTNGNDTPTRANGQIMEVKSHNDDDDNDHNNDSNNANLDGQPRAHHLQGHDNGGMLGDIQKEIQECKQRVHDAEIAAKDARLRKDHAKSRQKDILKQLSWLSGKAEICTPALKRFIVENKFTSWRVIGTKELEENWFSQRQLNSQCHTDPPSWEIDITEGYKWKLTYKGMERLKYSWDEDWIGRWIQRLEY